MCILGYTIGVLGYTRVYMGIQGVYQGYTRGIPGFIGHSQDIISSLT